MGRVQRALGGIAVALTLSSCGLTSGAVVTDEAGPDGGLTDGGAGHDGVTLAPLGRGIVSCPLAGCGQGPSVFAGGLGSIFHSASAAVDAQSIYLFVQTSADHPPWPTSNTDRLRLMRCPLAGCPAAGPIVVWTAPVASQTTARVALTATDVFFTAPHAGGVALMKMPK